MPDATTPPVSPQPQLSQQEIDSGKTMAILSYIPIALIGLVVSIVCISSKNNAYALFHAKQALALYICEIIAILICLPLCLLCIGFPLIMVVVVGTLVLWIVGIVNACSGVCKPLPVTGKFAEKWFGKVQKA